MLKTPLGYTIFLDTYTAVQSIHCKKRLTIFPSPAGMSQTNAPWRGIIYVIAVYSARESLVSDIPAGDEKIANFFYSVGRSSEIGKKCTIYQSICRISVYYTEWQCIVNIQRKNRQSEVTLSQKWDLQGRETPNSYKVQYSTVVF